MGEFIVHLKISIINIRKSHQELYYREKQIILELIYDLHKWLDFYDNRQGEDKEGPYDFTGSRSIRHRAKRHHLEGINEAVNIFSRQHGERFAGIIREEARRHIMDDMGAILCAMDYRAIGFWKNYGIS